MAQGLIRVTPEQLQQVSGQLRAGAANVDGTLAQLTSNVAPLGSDWAGMAQARFQELWAQYQRNARGLNDALNGIAQLMAQAAANYDQTEQSNVSLFNNV
ncbi:MAG: WXG100 family type VII secretion target [Actinomycetota bacterium]|nr:WXG100 family type VII secretion target [Actinomycetota bacterium]